MVFFWYRKIIISLIIVWLCIFTFFLPAQAIVNPLSAPNNRFGIHIIDQNDLTSAAQLVNSNGGEWGYVTLVIREDDRDQKKWQGIFDQMRRLKLIPLIRLATVPEGDTWRKPQPQDASGWADFLSSLNWVIKNRYIILYNEPNHAKEWGNDLKPEEYTRVVNAFYQALKLKSPDYFILPAGFDLSAPTAPGTMDTLTYWQFMVAEDPQVFSRFDGWTSHSYPNPGFSGSVSDMGRLSIKGYRWEIQTLSSLGLIPDIPVFITETGWLHTDGLSLHYGAYSPEKIADFFNDAFLNVWQDSNLVAVTPFLLNYQNPPFDHFSWTKPGGVEVYPHYSAVQLLPKIAGQPIQIKSAKIDSPIVPLTLINDSEYRLPINITNTGQTIWDTSTHSLTLDSLLIRSGSLTVPLPQLEPGEAGTVYVDAHTPTDYTSPITTNIVFSDAQGPFMSPLTAKTSLIPPPSLLTKVQLWYKRISTGNDFTLLIYDQNDVVKKIYPFSVTDGVGIVPEIRDVIPNQNYRFVITKPYYLPRQQFSVLNPQRTLVTFERLLPVDLYPDGQLTIKDYLFSLINPKLILTQLFKFT